MFRCNYVLPDGITHTKGFVKDPDEANRYLSLDEKEPSSPNDEVEQQDAPRERRNTDLTKTVYLLRRISFLVPKVYPLFFLFWHPSFTHYQLRS